MIGSDFRPLLSNRRTSVARVAARGSIKQHSGMFRFPARLFLIALGAVLLLGGVMGACDWLWGARPPCDLSAPWGGSEYKTRCAQQNARFYERRGRKEEAAIYRGVAASEAGLEIEEKKKTCERERAGRLSHLPKTGPCPYWLYD